MTIEIEMGDPPPRMTPIEQLAYAAGYDLGQSHRYRNAQTRGGKDVFTLGYNDAIEGRPNRVKG